MADRWDAYDYSRFDADYNYDNTVPVREEPVREPRKNIVEIPQEQLERNAKRKRHPVRAMASVLAFTVFLSLAASMVYSQQQLAELTEQINVTTRELEEAQSLEVQLTMQAAQKMNGAQVENYAVNKLGMGKITSSQVTYVNVAQEDHGVVLQSVEGGSIVDRVLSTVRSLFA